MKQTVLIFTGKYHFKQIDKTVPNGNYDENILMEVVNKCFPSDKFEVQIIDYPKCQCFRNIEEIWKEVRLPILIGYGKGADYIEPIKNYKRKYLISPKVFPNSFNELSNVDEYDEENTVCLFGGDEKSINNAQCYGKVYNYTHSEMVDGELDLCNGIENVAVFEALMFRLNH